MANRPVVSVITPTWMREDFLPLAHARLKSQTLKDIEWLVFDDSPTPSPYLSALAGPGLTYIHAGDRFNIGEKRNVLVEHARGDIIAHFDDDDFYAPAYLERMVARINAGQDLVKLSGWFLYSMLHDRLGYWDTACGGPHHRWGRQGCEYVSDNLPASPDNLDGYGFSYVYRRSVWLAGGFPTVTANEDTPFVQRARQRFAVATFADQEGLCLHTLHERSTSRCLPQYELPGFLATSLFGPEALPYLGRPGSAVEKQG